MMIWLTVKYTTQNYSMACSPEAYMLYFCYLPIHSYVNRKYSHQNSTPPYTSSIAYPSTRVQQQPLFNNEHIARGISSSSPKCGILGRGIERGLSCVGS